MHERAVVLRVVAELLVQRLLARELVLIVQDEELALGDGIPDGLEGLEVAHALEVVDHLERHRTVGMAARLS